MSCFLNIKYLFSCLSNPSSPSLSFSHLFPGGQEADINMPSVVVSLQELHNLQDNNGVIDVINVVQ